MKFGIFDQNDRSGRPLAQHYAERLEFLALCDELGFHAFHPSEHHATPLNQAPSQSVFLAAASQRTSRIRLVPLVYLLPLHHPLRLAEEICMLDHLSGGRIGFGVGRGASPFELAYMGIDPAEAPERYAEAFEVLIKALTAAGSLDHKGRFFTFRDVPIELQPLQRPHPPLWYAASSPESAVWPARSGINIVCGGPPRIVRPITDRYRAERQAAGLADGAEMPLVGVNRWVVLAESGREAVELGRRAWQPFHAHFMKLWLKHGAEPKNAKLPPDFDLMLKGGGAFAGTPESVAPRIARDVIEGGLNYFISIFTFGDLTLDEATRSARLFAGEVMPAVREAVAAG